MSSKPAGMNSHGVRFDDIVVGVEVYLDDPRPFPYGRVARMDGPAGAIRWPNGEEIPFHVDNVKRILHDVDGWYPPAIAGWHLWKEDRGPGSACARPGCGLYYSRWSGDRCPSAPWPVGEIRDEVARLLGAAVAMLDADRAPGIGDEQTSWLAETRRLIAAAVGALPRVG